VGRGKAADARKKFHSRSRLIETLGIDAVILATPTDRRAAGDVPLVEIPHALEGDVAAHRVWLRDIARDYDRLIVDTFPAGIQGELSGFANLPSISSAVCCASISTAAPRTTRAGRHSRPRMSWKREHPRSPARVSFTSTCRARPNYRPPRIRPRPAAIG